MILWAKTCCCESLQLGRVKGLCMLLNYTKTQRDVELQNLLLIFQIHLKTLSVRHWMTGW